MDDLKNSLYNYRLLQKAYIVEYLVEYAKAYKRKDLNKIKSLETDACDPFFRNRLCAGYDLDTLLKACRRMVKRGVEPTHWIGGRVLPIPQGYAKTPKSAIDKQRQI